jgi:hypothetical protein
MKKFLIAIIISLFFACSLQIVTATDLYNSTAHWIFNETTGTTVNDISGTNTASAPLAVTIVNGIIDNARYFNLSNQGNITVNNGMNISQNFTLSAWVNLASVPNVQSYGIIDKDISGGRSYAMFIQTGGFGNNATIYIQLNGAATCSNQAVFLNIAPNRWYQYLITRNGTNAINFYINGTRIYNCTDATSITATNTLVLIGNRGWNDMPMNGTIDEVMIINKSLNTSDALQLYNDIWQNITIPSLSNINCTSTAPSGDTISPYTTDDTTPTFSFDTSVNSNCRIANTNLSYTAMSSNRSCTSGEGAKIGHICTLTNQDELITASPIIFVSCKNSISADESSTALQMDIQNLNTNSSFAIQKGIEDSIIWPGVTVYDNQQVYLRNLQNNQVVGTVTKVAVYGNQRWIFNYANESGTLLGLFNITPVVYVLEMKNISLSQIRGMVTAYINSTKN